MAIELSDHPVAVEPCWQACLTHLEQVLDDDESYHCLITIQQ